MPIAIAFEFVLLGALWGSSFLFMRLGVAEFGPVATAGVRVMVGALCLAPSTMAGLEIRCVVTS